MTYEMYTEAGDQAVARAVRVFRSVLEPDERGRIATRRAALQTLHAELAAVARKHPEVADTAVRECVYYEVDKALIAAGYLTTEEWAA